MSSIDQIAAKNHLRLSRLLCGVVGLFTVLFSLHCGKSSRSSTTLSINYPFEGSLFAPEMPPPTVSWSTTGTASNGFQVTILERDGQNVLTHQTAESLWRPTVKQWERLKALSREKSLTLTVSVRTRFSAGKVQCSDQVHFATSADSVLDPIFYRDVELPFIDAVKDPSRIQWRFGSVGAHTQPPIVLEKLPVCGNCHSFSANGSTLGMDVDYANDKGSYALLPVAPQMLIRPSDIISWKNYRPDDQQVTFGLLSQVSPDGRYVTSTVKDRSVFVPKPQIEYSQLFFPIKGILAVYDRVKNSFARLPGADDPAYVQSNPSWSPDGQYIVFARNQAYELRSVTDRTATVLSAADCREFLNEGKKFRYDLYRVPFNDGHGGTAEPLPGASQNGKSNYFAKYSPDGRWIVFCQAESFMLLQPDSRLYIIPAQGGTARSLQCNRSGMNSWHSWSSNSRWLVFAAKTDHPYTQLYLTHIDENGNDSPPVILEQFTSFRRAANIPEFVHARTDGIQSIREQFVSSLSAGRIGRDYRSLLSFQGQNLAEQGDYAAAERNLNELLSLQPRDVIARYNLGVVYTHQNQISKAREQFTEVLRLQPSNPRAYTMLGVLAAQEQHYEDARSLALKALQCDPQYGPARKLLDQLTK